MILVSSTIVFLGACTEKMNSEQDEIRAYEWVTKGEDTYAKLIFNGENAVLTINSYDENCIIEGLCIFSDNNILIIDNNLETEFVFPYDLTGTSLTLDRYGEKTVFYKSTN